ncbi:methyltransferase domain-containing protein [Salinarimonas sp. NSM]|uniref:methyltransferase domain-containing protein n=1 Tax=Salinarimonas sp. NSM TaxID=3458003 RepID=UPI004036EB82
MARSGLYGGGDPLGYLLSEWRTRVVLCAINGFVVDLACGDNRIVRRHGTGRGVDIDARGQDDVLVAPDFATLPFETGSVDTVTIVASLNYFEAPLDVLREAHRILRPTGRLVLTMSNPAVMRVWHKFRDPWVRKPAVDDAELATLLSQSGFRRVARRGFMLGANALTIAEPVRTGDAA